MLRSVFDFESLPNEMQLEIIKQVEFRTLQQMKATSHRLKKFIQRYRRYTKPMPIAQMLVTPEKLSVTLVNSNDVVVMEPGPVADEFLRHAVVNLLWFENASPEAGVEPCELLSRLLPAQLKVAVLKLGSSRAQCDVGRLEALLRQWRCTNLLVEYRFHVPINFFDTFDLNKLDGLTIGETSAREPFNPLDGLQLATFRGTWLEVGVNRIEPIDVIQLVKRWKSGAIPLIVHYNIVTNFSPPSLAPQLRQEMIQISGAAWTTQRADGAALLLCYQSRSQLSSRSSIFISQTS